MKRWLPFPLLSVSLAAMWLMLNSTLEVAHVLLGLVLGWIGGLLLAQLQTPLGKVRRRAGTVILLLWLVFLDIVRSNVAVARISLNPHLPERRAGFLTFPLESRHPGALAILAVIITATPGTSWARYDEEHNTLTIHVLDLVDDQAWIDQFKTRYERRLLEIFR